MPCRVDIRDAVFRMRWTPGYLIYWFIAIAALHCTRGRCAIRGPGAFEFLSRLQHPPAWQDTEGAPGASWRRNAVSSATGFAGLRFPSQLFDRAARVSE